MKYSQVQLTAINNSSFSEPQQPPSRSLYTPLYETKLASILSQLLAYQTDLQQKTRELELVLNQLVAMDTLMYSP